MAARRLGVFSWMAVSVVLATWAGYGGAARARTAQPPGVTQASYSDDDFGYGGRYLTPQQHDGRDTWYFWTGGNQKFWPRMAELTDGHVDLLNYVDSRRHGRRFRELGAITEPGCEAAKAPDAHGLWLDECTPAGALPPEFGKPAGIVGLRRFDNPKFDPAKWDAQRYYANPKGMEPPYLIGMACGFCHIGFNPLNPPVDPERPRWSNLSPAIGNLFWREGRLFNVKMSPRDFRWHVGNRQPPGTSDTSRFATDHINNPNAINPIFNLAFRPTHEERMRDGSMRPVFHILKDGADSVGVAGASLRVYVNIGMCSDYTLTLLDPVSGQARPQQPFDMDTARATCADWRATEARMEAAEAFLKTIGPMRLADAPGGARHLTTDADLLRRGKLAFADHCARCHSSKRPPQDVASDPSRLAEWYRASVQAPDFLDENFLSDDARYPVTEIGTNVARAIGTNAARGHLWEQFSSETYKSLKAVGKVPRLYNPRKPEKPIDDFEIGPGGGGYYRTPSLVAVWATAPYLHNNMLGTFVPDPSVDARVVAAMDGLEKLLWPERRLGVQSMAVTSVDSELTVPERKQTVKVPAGTPVDLIARVDPTLTPRIIRNRVVLNLLSDDALFRGFWRNNRAPDFILDRGHTFGSGLPDEDKRALIEFLKTF